MSAIVKKQPATSATDEVVLVPTQSGDILEDKGKITLEHSQPDIINPQLTTPTHRNDENKSESFFAKDQASLAGKSQDLEELIFAQYQQLTAAQALLPLDKNDFAINLSKILSLLVDSELVNRRSETALSTADFATTNANVLLLKQQLMQKLQLNLSLNLKLHTGITALLNDFIIDNNWPRILAAWQILIQPTYQQLVGKTSWLEILAKQALLLLGEDWQQRAEELLKDQKTNLAIFFRDYFSSNEYLGLSLGITDEAQLRSFLTPILLSLPTTKLLAQTTSSVARTSPRAPKSSTKAQPTQQQAVLGLLKKQEEQHARRLGKLQQEFSLVQGKLNQLLTSKNQQQHLQKRLLASRKDLLAAKLEQSKAQLALRQLNQLKQQNTNYQKNTQALRQQAAQQQNQIEKLTAKLNHLQNENQDLEKYLSKLDSENEHLRQLRDAGIPATALKQQVALLQEAQLQDQNRLNALKQQNEQLQLALAAANQEKWRLQQQNIFADSQEELESQDLSAKQQRPAVSQLPPTTTQPAAKKAQKPTVNFLAYEQLFMPPAAPEFLSSQPSFNQQLSVEHQQSFSSDQQPSAVKKKRLSEHFPLCSRSGRELTFVLLSAQLERVLGGSLYALEKATRARTRLK